jgi:hypothetical protein
MGRYSTRTPYVNFISPRQRGISYHFVNSQMGHNWSELQGSQMVPPIRKPLQPLLSPPNPDSSALYTLTEEAVAPVVPIARNLHQRGSLVRTRSGSAAPPCPTISIFAFPGTLPH